MVPLVSRGTDEPNGAASVARATEAATAAKMAARCLGGIESTPSPTASFAPPAPLHEVNGLSRRKPASLVGFNHNDRAHLSIRRRAAAASPINGRYVQPIRLFVRRSDRRRANRQHGRDAAAVSAAPDRAGIGASAHSSARADHDNRSGGAARSEEGHARALEHRGVVPNAQLSALQRRVPVGQRPWAPSERLIRVGGADLHQRRLRVALCAWHLMRVVNEGNH